MQKRILSGVLALMLLLAGCNRAPVLLNEPEPTAMIYDWMAGVSPIPQERMYMDWYGENNGEYAIGPYGTYFISKISIIDGYAQIGDTSFVMYAEHGSSQVTKLCGRNDCTHDNSDCNAYLYQGSNLSYYHGSLYAVTGEGPFSEETKLIRMNPDGTGHEELLDLRAVAQDLGTEFADCRMITSGYCILTLYNWVEQEDGTMNSYNVMDCKIDLSDPGKGPEPIQSDSMLMYPCAGRLITRSYVTVDGAKQWIGHAYDLETNTTVSLMPVKGPGWYGEEEAYYYAEGAIKRFTYATQEEEILVRTGLEGSYYLYAFPDCLILVNQEGSTDRNLYIYNWAFELVDTVLLDYHFKGVTQFGLYGETVDRIFLSTSWDAMPQYYIHKSELGTGNVQLHEMQYQE